MTVSEKRVTAHIIPYRIREGQMEFFLQQRSQDAERHPGGLSIFGGGVEEGETSEEAMVRESKEELGFVPKHYVYIGEYSDVYSISHYYTVAVDNDFENVVTIGEGEYGVFVSEKELEKVPSLSDHNKHILQDVLGAIKGKRSILIQSLPRVVEG